MSRARPTILGAALACFAIACGPPPAPPPPPSNDPGWADVIEGNEALVAVIRPKALAHDAVFGPLTRSAFATGLVKGMGASFDIFPAVEEMIAIFPEPGSDGSVLVLEGVDADRAPEKMTDDRGQAIFVHGADAHGSLSEFVDAHGKDASLFTLPHRTWVIASGASRKPARVAFAHPANRPVPSYGDDKALVVARFEGNALVQHLPGLRNGRLAPIGKNLALVTALLMPDGKGVQVTARYANDDQAGFAALAIEDVRKALAEKTYPWLSTATVERDGNRDVKIHIDIPKDIVEKLRHAQPQDFSNL